MRAAFVYLTRMCATLIIIISGLVYFDDTNLTTFVIWVISCTIAALFFYASYKVERDV